MMSIDDYLKRERKADKRRLDAMTKSNSMTKIVVFSVVLYIGLGIPLGLFHEVGHASVCALEGHQVRVWVDARGGHTLCNGQVQNELASSVMGPLFGVALASGVFMLGRWRQWIPLMAVGAAFTVEQGVKVVLEGFYAPVYESGALDSPLLALQLVTWFGFIIYYLARIYQKEKKEVSK